MGKFICYQRSYQQGLSDLRALLRKQAAGLDIAGFLPREVNEHVCDLITAMIEAPVTSMTYGKSVEVHLYANGNARILPPGREAQHKRAQEIILHP